MKYLIAYVILAVIYESIHLTVSWKQFKKNVHKFSHWEMIKSAFLASKSGQALKKKIWNWYTITFVAIPLFIFICPFIFPFSLFLHTKKVLGIKSKLEIEAEKEIKLMEEAKIKSEEFMKNEGEVMFEEIIKPMSEEDDTNQNNEINIK